MTWWLEDVIFSLVVKNNPPCDILYIHVFSSVIAAKFPDVHRVFSSGADTVHYLAVLNAGNPDMFVLLHIDEHNDTAVSIFIAFEMELLDGMANFEGKSP